MPVGAERGELVRSVRVVTAVARRLGAYDAVIWTPRDRLHLVARQPDRPLAHGGGGIVEDFRNLRMADSIILNSQSCSKTCIQTGNTMK